MSAVEQSVVWCCGSPSNLKRVPVLNGVIKDGFAEANFTQKTERDEGGDRVLPGEDQPRREAGACSPCVQSRKKTRWPEGMRGGAVNEVGTVVHPGPQRPLEGLGFHLKAVELKPL